MFGYIIFVITAVIIIFVIKFFAQRDNWDRPLTTILIGAICTMVIMMSVVVFSTREAASCSTNSNQSCSINGRRNHGSRQLDVKTMGSNCNCESCTCNDCECNCECR